jgi:hypothetical protein
VSVNESIFLQDSFLSLLLNGGGDALPQLVKDSQKQAWANLRYLMEQKEGEEN